MQLLELFHELTVRPQNAKELKGLILQLAVQGKLTANWRQVNPGIESADFLLQKIEIERQQLVKDKVIRKTKPLTKVSDEEQFFKIPSSWEWERLGNIGNIFNGNSVNKSIKEAKYSGLETGYPYIATKDVGYSFEPIDHENGVRIPFDESKFKVARKNTVLICSEGGSAGKKMGVLEENACFGNKLYAIEQYGDIESIYILALYGSQSFSEAFRDKMTGIIGGISRNNFAHLPIPLPPLEEQKAIVEIVESLFKEVEQLELLTEERVQLKEDFATSALRQLTEGNTSQEWQQLQPQFNTFFDNKVNIKKFRESILQLAVQGKLTANWRALRLSKGEPIEPASELLKRIQAEKEQLIKEKKIKKEKPLPPISEEEIPYELPEGWEWSQILDISMKVTDGEHSTPLRTETGYYLLSARNVTNEGINLDKVDFVGEEEFQRIRKRCDPQKGDVLISCSGSVGRVCIVDKDDEYCMVRSAALVKQNHDNILGQYIVYSLRAPFVQTQIIEKSRSTAQSNLFLGKIKELVFPLPPLEEQKAIVEKVNQLMAYCDELEEQVKQSQTHAEQLMQSVLREVFGK